MYIYVINLCILLHVAVWTTECSRTQLLTSHNSLLSCTPLDNTPSSAVQNTRESILYTLHLRAHTHTTRMILYTYVRVDNILSTLPSLLADPLATGFSMARTTYRYLEKSIVPVDSRLSLSS